MEANMADTDTQDSALERMSVAPEVSKGDAGGDKSIEKRLEKHPESKEARLDRGLDESMDASDPPSAAQPGDKGEPPKSSGFDEAAEAERQQDS
jgi:hypothetical protein